MLTTFYENIEINQSPELNYDHFIKISPIFAMNLKIPLKVAKSLQKLVIFFLSFRQKHRSSTNFVSHID